MSSMSTPPPWRSRFLPLLGRKTSPVELNLGGYTVQDEVESTLKPLIIGNVRGHLDESLHVRIISGGENCFREIWVIDRLLPYLLLTTGRPQTFGGNKAVHKYEQYSDNSNSGPYVQSNT
jgi:hypothetical protein